MNRVFEDFVVVALREALRVSDREFPQGASGRSLRLAHPNRITLRPDISWWHERECVFVGDVKYKRLDVAGYRHADLYQLLAYTVAADLPGGILVYAKGERPSSHYRIHNSDKVLEVLTLSLDGDPEEVLAEVAGVARRVRQLRATALRRTRDVNHQRAAS
jgi:5-methylcytosine-specific restriction enzyme subunit McrC